MQTGRLDVARICLGHLQRPRSVRALRLAEADATLEPDARIAVLAIELGLIAEAERLYRRCARFDLLNNLLQACGRYDEALAVAESDDRVHLRHTWWVYAGWLRSEGRTAEALTWYGKCGTAVADVTQMLLQEMTAAELQQHVMGGGADAAADPQLLHWYARFVESTGDMDAAFACYQRAGDWFAQVRILCFTGQLTRADSVACLSGDRAACYHLARHYENHAQRPLDAIKMYRRAQTVSNVVRLCRELLLTEELWQCASTMARGRDARAAAQYFEELEPPDAARAVELYWRVGDLHRAVDLAFASGQPAVLQVIAAELGERGATGGGEASEDDVRLVHRCAEFFVHNGQPERAVQLLARSQLFAEALRVCADANVRVTETMADELTPTAHDAADAGETERRKRALVQLGELLHAQGDYHTAAKKFTQAGDRRRAMRALLKSGDTEKIVFFASMSREREVYVMAANYLQALRWRGQPKVYKNIVSFYERAQAYEELANFHVTCAEAHIAEQREYAAALAALEAGQVCLGKVQKQQQQKGAAAAAGAGESVLARAAERLRGTVAEVRRVVEVQAAMERGEYASVVAVCRSVLGE